MSRTIPDISPWREPCADFATASIYARHANQLARFGERGRQQCRRDILFHLDYLQAALLADDAGIFSQYAMWLKEVLRSRGVPASHLDASLEFVAAFFDNNLPADVTDMISAVLRAGRAALSQETLSVTYGEMRLPELSQTQPFRESILQGRHKSAASLMSQIMDQGVSLTQASVRLVQPALYQVGLLWQSNRITVAQEHLATAISQNILASAYVRAQFAPPVGRTAMFACVEGNHHSVGLHILSDAVETAGWDVLNLGANLPMADLRREVDSRHPDLLALSASLPGHIATARRTIAMLRAELGSACPTIWVGGLGSLGDRETWRITGADGWAADALDALKQL